MAGPDKYAVPLGGKPIIISMPPHVKGPVGGFACLPASAGLNCSRPIIGDGTMRLFQRILAVGALICGFSIATADWTGFRGPAQDGASPERGLPVKWGPEQNVVWKLKLPGPGSSSPIVLGDKLFVTCYSGYGIPNQPGGEKSDINNLKRHLLCVERTSGKILWDKQVPAKQPESPYSKQIAEHGYATSTPVTDGERVYAFFGKTGVFAFDLN